MCIKALQAVEAVASAVAVPEVVLEAAEVGAVGTHLPALPLKAPVRREDAPLAPCGCCCTSSSAFSSSVALPELLKVPGALRALTLKTPNLTDVPTSHMHIPAQAFLLAPHPWLLCAFVLAIATCSSAFDEISARRVGLGSCESDLMPCQCFSSSATCLTHSSQACAWVQCLDATPFCQAFARETPIDADCMLEVPASRRYWRCCSSSKTLDSPL